MSIVEQASYIIVGYTIARIVIFVVGIIVQSYKVIKRYKVK